MTKARDLANLIAAGNPLADGALAIDEVSGLTSSLAAKQAIVTGVSDTEIGYLDGVTSALQTQLNNISVTSGSLTKSFTNGETASITLGTAISPAPVVSVIKEVPQVGVSSKGAWDVNATSSNYELHNTAYATTLTTGATLALGTGSFASTDVGKRIVGNGGDVTLTSTAGAYSTTGGSAFTDGSTIASGSWSMRGLKSAGDADGIKLNHIAEVAATYSSTFRLASYSDVYASASQANTVVGLHMARNGSHANIGNQNGTIKVYSLSTAFLPSSASYQGSYTLSGSTASNFDIEFNETGTRMFVQNYFSSTEAVKLFSLSVPWRPDTGTVTLLATYDLNVSETTSAISSGGSIQFSNDGKSFYYCPDAYKSGNSTEGASQKAGQSFSVGSSSGVVYYWTLSTAYDLSSRTYQGYKRVPHYSYSSFGVSEDGKWLINGAYGSNNVVYYPVPTAWDITSINSANEVLFYHSSYSPSGSTEQIASSFVGDNYYTMGYNDTKLVKFPWGPAKTSSAVTGYVPDGYQIGVTNSGGQIDSATWVDINSMTADQTLGGGTVHYAVSTDDRTTWSVAKASDGVRPIVRDNSGTWQYNSDATYGSTTWANSTTNDEFYALQQALGATSVNRMDKTQLDAVADGSHFTLGNTLDLAIALKLDTALGSTPTSDGVSINYDAAAIIKGAVLGTDYDYDFPDSTTVRVTSNAAQNLKVRIV